MRVDRGSILLNDVVIPCWSLAPFLWALFVFCKFLVKDMFGFWAKRGFRLIVDRNGKEEMYICLMIFILNYQYSLYLSVVLGKSWS